MAGLKSHGHSGGRNETRESARPVRTARPLPLGKGAITVAETLIVLGIGLVALTIWAQAKLHQLETVNAGNAGRAIAAYSRLHQCG